MQTTIETNGQNTHHHGDTYPQRPPTMPTTTSPQSLSTDRNRMGNLAMRISQDGRILNLCWMGRNRIGLCSQIHKYMQQSGKNFNIEYGNTYVQGEVAYSSFEISCESYDDAYSLFSHLEQQRIFDGDPGETIKPHGEYEIEIIAIDHQGMLSKIVAMMAEHRIDIIHMTTEARVIQNGDELDSIYRSGGQPGIPRKFGIIVGRYRIESEQQHRQFKTHFHAHAKKEKWSKATIRPRPIPEDLSNLDEDERITFHRK